MQYIVAILAGLSILASACGGDSQSHPEAVATVDRCHNVTERDNRARLGCLTQSDIARQAVGAEGAADLFLSAVGDMPADLKQSLRPSLVAYFLADSLEEKQQAKAEIAQTILLWRTANRPQGDTTIVVTSGGSTSGFSNLQTGSGLRDMQHEIDLLRRCINFGVSCY